MPNRADHIKRLLIANYRASPVKALVLAVVAVALLVLIARQLSGGASKADAAMPINTVIPPESTQPTEGVHEAAARAPRREKPSITRRSPRDLFSTEWLESLPLNYGAADAEAGATEQPAELSLQFTITGPSREECTAVISGVIVHPDSVIDGFTVEGISDRTVVLRKGSERKTLRMR